MGQKGGGSPGCCDSCPNHDRLGILTSGDDPSFSGRQGGPNSITLLVYHLLNVEFLLICENQVGQLASINVLQNFPAFLGPHCHMTICKLMMMHHPKEFSSKIISQHLVHCGFAHTNCCSQCPATSTRVALQLFLMFLMSCGVQILRFFASQFPVEGVTSLLKLLNNFPNC